MAIDRKSVKNNHGFPPIPLIILDDGHADNARPSVANALCRRPFVRLPLLVTAPTNSNVDDGGSGRQTEELRASVVAADADAVVNAIVDATVTYTQKIQNSASVGTGGGRSPVAGRSPFFFRALPPGRRPKGRPHAFISVLPRRPPRTDGCDRQTTTKRISYRTHGRRVCVYTVYTHVLRGAGGRMRAGRPGGRGRSCCGCGGYGCCGHLLLDQ